MEGEGARCAASGTRWKGGERKGGWMMIVDIYPVSTDLMAVTTQRPLYIIPSHPLHMHISPPSSLLPTVSYAVSGRAAW